MLLPWLLLLPPQLLPPWLQLLAPRTLEIVPFIFLRPPPHLTQKYFVYWSPGFPVLPILTIGYILGAKEVMRKAMFKEPGICSLLFTNFTYMALEILAFNRKKIIFSRTIKDQNMCLHVARYLFMFAVYQEILCFFKEFSRKRKQLYNEAYLWQKVLSVIQAISGNVEIY